MANDQNAIRDTILQLISERGADKTICPSEAARAIAGKDETKWRLLMKPIKKEAIALATAGLVTLKRKGKSVIPSELKGIYRIGLPDDREL